MGWKSGVNVGGDLSLMARLGISIKRFLNTLPQILTAYLSLEKCHPNGRKKIRVYQFCVGEYSSGCPGREKF